MSTLSIYSYSWRLMPLKLHSSNPFAQSLCNSWSYHCPKREEIDRLTAPKCGHFSFCRIQLGRLIWYKPLSENNEGVGLHTVGLSSVPDLPSSESSSMPSLTFPVLLGSLTLAHLIKISTSHPYLYKDTWLKPFRVPGSLKGSVWLTSLTAELGPLAFFQSSTSWSVKRSTTAIYFRCGPHSGLLGKVS